MSARSLETAQPPPSTWQTRPQPAHQRPQSARVDSVHQKPATTTTIAPLDSSLLALLDPLLTSKPQEAAVPTGHSANRKPPTQPAVATRANASRTAAAARPLSTSAAPSETPTFVAKDAPSIARASSSAAPAAAVAQSRHGLKANAPPSALNVLAYMAASGEKRAAATSTSSSMATATMSAAKAAEPPKPWTYLPSSPPPSPNFRNDSRSADSDDRNVAVTMASTTIAVRTEPKSRATATTSATTSEAISSMIAASTSRDAQKTATVASKPAAAAPTTAALSTTATASLLLPPPSKLLLDGIKPAEPNGVLPPPSKLLLEGVASRQQPPQSATTTTTTTTKIVDSAYSSLSSRTSSSSHTAERNGAAAASTAVASHQHPPPASAPLVLSVQNIPFLKPTPLIRTKPAAVAPQKPVQPIIRFVAPHFPGQLFYFQFCSLVDLDIDHMLARVKNEAEFAT